MDRNELFYPLRQLILFGFEQYLVICVFIAFQ